MNYIKSRLFINGVVYALQTFDSYPIEVTDTFLPYYTKYAINRKQNDLYNKNIGNRLERWMIGVSCMSGCQIHCKFCATGNFKKCRNLSSEEILEQIKFVLNKNNINPRTSKEFKINYTRMGEPFLNIEEIQKAIKEIDIINPKTHHYISTIGIKGSNFDWIKDNIALQISLHSLNEERRDKLIPYKNKMSIKELGQIRTKSNLKITVNLTLVNEEDFDIEELYKYFDPEYFFIKLSPINTNIIISNSNNMG